MQLNALLKAALRRWYLFTIILALLGAGTWYFLLRDTKPSVPAVPQVKTVERGDLRVSVSGSGQVEAQSQVDLKSVVSGDGADVTSVQVKNDQEVKKGQIIATIDSTDASRAVKEAELSLRAAEIKMKQTEKLYDAETKADKWERQLQEVTVSESALAVSQAREKLQDYTVRAPFDGIVTALSVEAGDSLANDTILASVITRQMKVKITLNEVDAAKVQEGDTVTLAFDALPNTTLTGTVSKLDTIGTTDQGVVSYGAEIALDEQNEALRPGMSVSAEIAVEEKESVLLVPNEAITYEDGKAFVRVTVSETGQQPPNRNGNGNVSGGGRQRKEIQVGITDDVNTEVTSGLSEGDRVIVSTASGTGQSARNMPAGQSSNPLNSIFGGNRRTFGGGGGG